MMGEEEEERRKKEEGRSKKEVEGIKGRSKRRRVTEKEEEAIPKPSHERLNLAKKNTKRKK
jgi:hypothetical protein